METGLVAALGAAAALLLIALCVLLVAVFTDRRRTRRELAAARADLEVLRARLDEIEGARRATVTPAVVPQAEYLITTAGATSDDDDTDPERISNRAVLSVTFGEPLVKAMALGYGVRRALSPQTRNRITFEMRREVRRARKARRRAGRRAARADVPGAGREAAA